MALNLYQDSELRLIAGQLTPKRFLLPLAGGNKASSLWLGDPYFATISIQAITSDTVLHLNQTEEFLNSGTAIVNGQVVTYTGKTISTLTGVAGITTTINVNSIIVPDKKYIGSGNLIAFPAGIDLTQGVQISLKLPTDTEFGFPGGIVILPITSIGMGISNAIQFNVQAAIAAGIQQEFTNWSINLSPVYVRNISDSTTVQPGEIGIPITAYGYIFRRDQALPQGLRLFPTSRQVNTALPGFVVGDYRWRDENTRNATALIPSNWNINPKTLGLEKFVAGIGSGIDLEPLAVEEVTDSIYLDVQSGSYFTGPERYYLSAIPELEFWPAQQGSVTHTLLQTPAPQIPIFVGNWVLDSEGFYEKNIEYRYIGITTNPDNTARTDLPTYYYTRDQRSNNITLNQGLDNITLYIGTLSGQTIDYFDMPIYPVYDVQQVYINQGLGNPIIPCTNFVFDRDEGTLVITNPTGGTPSIPNALKNQPIYAVCSPAVACLYETSISNTRQLSQVDLNPAFSGLANGYVYLQHRRQKPASIVLSCDKPLIIVPPSASNIAGLLAFGPVYFDGDYALLSAQAFSAVPNEVVPNAILTVVPGAGFSGLINYQDPTTTQVQVKTGGDGIAQMIYTPTKNFGIWVPTIAAAGTITSLSLGGLATTYQVNDTIVLPAPVSIDEIRNPQEGWLVTLYNVFNNNPLFGLVGANPALGEIAWLATGTPGGVDYKTNGVREAWTLGPTLSITPIEARDANGNNYVASGFNGTVKQLVYSTPIVTGPTIGSYFITFVQRVTLFLQAENSNVESNSILLQMATPGEIFENPWLVIEDDIFGLVNVYRLGWVPPTVRGI